MIEGDAVTALVGKRLPGRAARIQDVARLAGVSTATVSRALASPERVSLEMRTRVLEAIAKIGYVPNPAARTLRSQKSRMVLVVLPTLDNIFFSKILRGIEETLFAAGYGMIIGDLDGSPEKEARFAAFAAAGQVDGALLLNGHLFGLDHKGVEPEQRTRVPLVAVCEAIPGTEIPQVEVGNRAAARNMTLYLASLGHRRIAYLCGPADNVLEHERFRGYREGLREAGLAFDRNLVWPGDYTLEAGLRAGHRIIGRRRRPTAVFSSNDEMAIGLIRALVSAGIRVPQDISVAGFDDIEFAAMVDPALTTVHQPRREHGRTGAEILIRLLTGETVPGQIRLPTEIRVRGSTGPFAEGE
jgi:LacI family transcriptional regulator, repressor for deo operon, udp, cdd, tsx, nupC, and nupG